MTPIFTISETISFILSGVQDRSDTNVAVKLIKDFIFVVIIFLGVLSALQYKKLIINKYLFLLYVLILSSLLMSYLNSSHYMILIAGIRWAIPLLLIAILLKYIDFDLQQKISKILIYLFFLAFVLQVIELLYMPHFWGTNSFGLSARNPGFFAQNNTMAFFTLIVFYYSIAFENSKRLSKFVYILVPLSIYLTSSGTGVAVLGVMYLYLLYSKVHSPYLKASFSIALVSLLGLFLYLLPILTNRRNIYESILIRVEIFFRSFSFDNLIISKNFGEATNTGVLMNHKYGLESMDFFIADSTFTSLLANIGLLGLLFFLFVIYYVRNKSVDYILFVSVFGLFSLTSIIFEAYPMNLLFAVNIAYFYKLKMDRRIVSV